MSCTLESRYNETQRQRQFFTINYKEVFGTLMLVLHGFYWAGSSHFLRSIEFLVINIFFVYRVSNVPTYLPYIHIKILCYVIIEA